jgi:methylthioribulose-1-phosphate dehydratase
VDARAHCYCHPHRTVQARRMTSPTDPREILAATARELYRRGWMSGTAGNLSLRLPDSSFWITASGKAKGSLGAEDFLRLAPGGEVVERGRPEDRPSAEASLHDAVYALFPEARACYHVHTVAANVAARLAAGGDLPLPPIEMLKGLGVADERPDVTIAVLPNHADVPAIAAELAARFRAARPRLPGFLIRDHGLTAWGTEPAEAMNRLELFEFLFDCLVTARRAGLGW